MQSCGHLFGNNSINMSDNLSDVQKFYSGTTVFLTGATGLLGKLILEKLLRSCGQVKRIYILVRQKKGVDEDDRIEELFENPVFERMRSMGCDFKRYVFIMKGDCADPYLGLSENDRSVLSSTVDVIIHCAATVRFDQKLSTAVKINIRSTRDLLDIAKHAPNLKAFIHVSTAYAYCLRTELIDEQCYQPRFTGRHLLSVLDLLGEEFLDMWETQFLGKWPNTYAFTKSATEHMLCTEGKGFPIAIVRPSMVASTCKEPIPGYIDNFYGPNGAWSGVSVGLVRVLAARAKTVGDIIPADYVSNAILCAAWSIGHDRIPKEQVKFFNVVSSCENPLTIYDQDCFRRETIVELASVKLFWYPFTFFARDMRMYRVTTFFLHTIPAAVVDLLALCTGRTPRMIATYKKFDSLAKISGFFCTREWEFSNKNTQVLLRSLCEKDRQLFDFDVSTLNWKDFFVDYMRGIRVFLFKDPLESLPKGERLYKKLKCLHYCLMTTLSLLSLYCFIRSLTRRNRLRK